MRRQFLPSISLRLPLCFSLLVILNSAFAQTNFTLLKNFSGVPDGVVPYGGLIDGKDGALYGATIGGGTSNMGTVFRLKPDGSDFSILHTFVGSDGGGPYSALVLGANGSLYGTTYGGGTSNFGTVFKLGRDGSGFASLHSFIGGADSENPETGLIEGSDGALYGTTVFGDGAHRGTIFKLNKDGSGYSVIHNFTGNPDGQQPEGRLLEGSDGLLYGTTAFGGPSVGGTVYALQKDGGGYGLLYNFQTSGGDGVMPVAGLVEGSDGVLYGTTYHGGSDHDGTVFKINKDGSGYAILRSFLGTGGDGQRPNSELVEGADGALYGGTDYGGSTLEGTIFKLNKDASGYTILRSFFRSNGDGGVPRCALIQLNNGIFYGTTEYGGNVGGGCVFALSTVPLPARVLSISTGGSNLLQFAATSVAQYDLQRSTNLASWTFVATLTSQTNGLFQYSDFSPPQPRGFYRLKVH